MISETFMGKSAAGAAWQDYRASNTGMVIFYGSDPISELPIREVPESFPSEIPPEPNYETGTFGYFSCAQTKIRATFVKSKVRYLIFLTKYAGAIDEFKDQYLVTGYYRVAKIADVKKHHIRNCSDYSCLDENVCYALKADEVRFVTAEDAFPVSAQMLKDWGATSRITRQSRIMLNEEQTSTVLAHLKSKDDIQGLYAEETARLQPNADEENEDGDE